MIYKGYVSQLNKEHEGMVKTVDSGNLRKYVRHYMKRVLNEIHTLKRNQSWKRDEQMDEKIAFNEVLVKSIENYLS